MQYYLGTFAGLSIIALVKSTQEVLLTIIAAVGAAVVTAIIWAVWKWLNKAYKSLQSIDNHIVKSNDQLTKMTGMMSEALRKIEAHSEKIGQIETILADHDTDIQKLKERRK